MKKNLLIICSSIILAGSVYADAPIEDYSINNSDNLNNSQVTAPNSNTTQNSNSTWQEIKAENNKAQTSTNYNATANSSNPTNITTKDINTANLSIEQRVNRLEQQINYLNNSNLPSQLEKIQQQLQSLNGTTEDQQHKIDEIKQQVEQFYNDLDQRLNDIKKTSIQTKNTNLEDKTKVTNKVEKTESLKKINTSIDDSKVVKTADTTKTLQNSKSIKTDTTKIETKKPEIKTIGKTNLPEASNSDTENSPSDSDQPLQIKEQKMYQSALDDLRNKNFTTGSQKLEQYIKAYPNGLYTANAHYWLGEIYLLRGTYDKASSEFNIIKTKYASSQKVADALFKIAYIHEKQGNKDLAIKEYKDLQKRYPHSSASKLAEKQLA